MSLTSDIHQDIGSLKAKVNSLEHEVKELRRELREVCDFVHETKAGKRWLFVSLSVAAALGALLDQVLRYFKFFG